MADEKQELDPGQDQQELEGQGANTADADGLQAEVDELRRYKDETEARKTDRHRWRRLAVALLIVLGCVDYGRGQRDRLVEERGFQHRYFCGDGRPAQQEPGRGLGYRRFCRGRSLPGYKRRAGGRRCSP